MTRLERYDQLLVAATVFWFVACAVVVAGFIWPVNARFMRMMGLAGAVALGASVGAGWKAFRVVIGCAKDSIQHPDMYLDHFTKGK